VRFGVLRFPAGPMLLVLAGALPAAAQNVRLKTDITGLEGAPLANARLLLSTNTLPDKAISPLQARRLFARGGEELALALQPFGFYRATVDSKLDEQGSEWTAHYAVKPGPAVTIDFVDVRVEGDGAQDSTIVAALNTFPLTPGDTLVHAPYDLFKLTVASTALDAGYLDAKWTTHEISVNRESSRATIRAVLETGPLYRFGKTTLRQDWVNERLLLGQIPYKEGDPFRFSKLLALQAALTSVPYFTSVEIRPDRGHADGTSVPVDATFTPSRPRRWEVGAGYGTDTGLRGKARVEFRRLNRAGHFGDIDLQVSQVESSLGAQYKIPTYYPHTELFTIYGGFGRLTPDWSASWRSTLGVSMSRVRWGWREIVSLAFEHESFTVADQDGSSMLLIPGLTLNRTWSAGGSNPRRGVKLRAGVSGAFDGPLSNATFATLDGEARFIRPLTQRSRILLRLEGGKTFTSDITELPPSHRFVTGGDGTIRGFAFQSLGPRNADSALVGGSSMFVGSLEADMIVWRTMGIAAFFDFGNAYGEAAIQSAGIEHGTGLGLRWQSPIGPLRLDFAFATSQPGTPFRIHFSIGPDL
jgi:translocation and assembly module TamA